MARFLIFLVLATGMATPQTAPKTAPPPIEEGQTIKIDVDLVNIFFTVRERSGSYIASLSKDDFEIFENGKKQEVKFFSRESDLPLTIGLLVDVSKSQESLIEVEREASYRFFSQVLREKDLAFIISFGTDSDLLQDLTGSLPLLQKGLKALRLSAAPSGGVVTPSPVPIPGGGRGTVLYEALWLAAKERLQAEVGRKAVILITDGVDVGSRTKPSEALEAAQRADAIIYTILYEDPRYTDPFYGGQSGEGAMRKLSEETGGRLFRVSRKDTLNDIYDQIQKELRSQYTIGYTSTNGSGDNTFRKLEIRTKSKDFRVQARKGYYSSPSSGN
jgi:VWFA-related protein